MPAADPTSSSSSVPSAALPLGGTRGVGRPPAKKDLIGEGEANPADSLSLAQLLISRMCHDLSGAVGVTASAEDLIGSGPELEADAVSLVADAGRRAAARLAFFRAAFGFDRTSRGMTLSQLRAMIEPALDRPRLGFEWQGDISATVASPELPTVAGRILLCLTLLASEALPRGGTIRVTTGGGLSRSGVSIEAEGPGARVTPQVLQALAAADCGELTSATVVGYYAQVLAGRMAAAVVTDGGDGRIRLSFTPAGSGGGRRH